MTFKLITPLPMSYIFKTLSVLSHELDMISNMYKIIKTKILYIKCMIKHYKIFFNILNGNGPVRMAEVQFLLSNRN